MLASAPNRKQPVAAPWIEVANDWAMDDSCRPRRAAPCYRQLDRRAYLIVRFHTIRNIVIVNRWLGLWTICRNLAVIAGVLWAWTKRDDCVQGLCPPLAR